MTNRLLKPTRLDPDTDSKRKKDCGNQVTKYAGVHANGCVKDHETDATKFSISWVSVLAQGLSRLPQTCTLNELLPQ